jgi:alpha-tubulin suppressor-like RCC1 family protein
MVAYCVGRNEDSQLGDGTLTNRDSLKRVAGGNRFIAISAGDRHTCAIALGTRKMLCWGDNSFGQLGNAISPDQPTPVAVSGDLSFAVVSAGEGYTCGVTVQGTAYCWGQNVAGQLGDGSLTNQETPVQVLAP